jgi:hypothetical protein
MNANLLSVRIWIEVAEAGGVGKDDDASDSIAAQSTNRALDQADRSAVRGPGDFKLNDRC